MSYKIVVSYEAELDILDIFRYIYLKLASPDAARRQIQAIEAEIRSLDQMPDRFGIYQGTVSQKG